MANQTRRIVTEKECAAYLHLQPGTLTAQRYRKSGPPYLRINRMIRYDLDVVDCWLDGQQVQPAAAPAPQPVPKPPTDLPAWLQPLGESMTRDQSNITGASS